MQIKDLIGYLNWQVSNILLTTKCLSIELHLGKLWPYSQISDQVQNTDQGQTLSLIVPGVCAIKYFTAETNSIVGNKY